MRSSIEVITPQRAAEILQFNNRSNRPLNKQRVARYREEMRAGRWVLSPQGLSFDHSGELVDGQHRLAALKSQTAPQSFWVMWDVDQSAALVLDQGLTRTAAQLAATSLDTDANVARLVAAARAVIELGKGQSKPSNGAVVDFARSHQTELERYAEVGRHYTAAVQAAFVFAEMSGLTSLAPAADRLVELHWRSDDDPMRALARALTQLGSREGARARQTRFYTTLTALAYVDRGEGLTSIKKHDSLPHSVESAFAVN